MGYNPESGIILQCGYVQLAQNVSLRKFPRFRSLKFAVKFEIDKVAGCRAACSSMNAFTEVTRRSTFSEISNQSINLINLGKKFLQETDSFKQFKAIQSNVFFLLVLIKVLKAP